MSDEERELSHYELFIEHGEDRIFEELKSVLMKGLEEHAKIDGVTVDSLIPEWDPEDIINWGWDFVSDVLEDCDCAGHRNHALSLKIVVAMMHELFYILPKNMSKKRRRDICTAFMAAIYKIDHSYAQYIEDRSARTLASQLLAPRPVGVLLSVPVSDASVSPTMGDQDPEKKPN